MKVFQPLLYLFVSLALAGAAPDTPAEGPSCAKLLAGKTNVKEIHEIVNAAIAVKGPNVESTQRNALEGLLDNTAFMDALNKNDIVATETMTNVINKGSSQSFYRQAISMMGATGNSKLKPYIKIANDSVLPITMNKPLPVEVFQRDVPLTHDVEHTLGALFDYNPKMLSTPFSRRLFAYMGQHSEYTQDQKYNLTINFMRAFQKAKNDYNATLPNTKEGIAKRTYFTFYEPNIYMPSKTQIICGSKHCNYFYAITKDGKFFIGNTGPEKKPLIYGGWNDNSDLIREAKPE